MSQDFEHKLERQEGGNPVTLSVKDNAVMLTIDPPVKSNEREAMDGLRMLAEDALKRKLEPQQAGEISSLHIKTDDRDPALAVVIAQALEAHGVLKGGEAKKFEQAIDKAGHAQEQEVAKAAPAHSTADQLAAIRQAMAGKVTQSEMPEQPSHGAPAREQSPAIGRSV